MRRRMLVIAIAATAALGGTALAASVPVHNSKVKIDSAAIGPGHVLATGRVTSPVSKCVVGRLVKILAVTASGQQLVSTDHASINGYFGGEGNTSDAIGAKVVATRKRYGRRGHRQVCKAASDILLIPIRPL